MTSGRGGPLVGAVDVVDCVRRALPSLDGVRVLDRLAGGGEAAADLAAVDGRGRALLVACDVEAGPATVLRAMESVARWSEERGLVRRFGGVVDPTLLPRALVIGVHFSEPTLRFLRRLGPAAPAALRCVTGAAGADRLVSVEPLPEGGRAAEASR